MTSDTIPESLMSIATITNEALPGGNIGAVVSRAGVGKTSFLVHMALNGMLLQKNVLHVNVSDPIKKIALWYREVFTHIADKHSIAETVKLDDFISRRFIMTLQISGFSVASLKERISDLVEQDIFSPNMLVIDGLSFDESRHDEVSELKALADEFGIGIWIAVPAHREEDRDDNGMPARITEVADLFDLVWELLPDGKKIDVVPLKQAQAIADDVRLFIDPASMLLGVSS